MKKQLCIGMMGLLALGVVSCSDDESEIAGGGYGLVASTTPQLSSMGIEFPVTELRIGSSARYKIEYADGRMVSAEDSYMGDCVFSFNPLRLTFTTSYDTETFQNFKTNSKGYLTYSESHGFDDEDEEPYYWDVSSTYAYDDEGHLLLEKSVVTDSDGDDEEYTIVYTWENGNLMSIKEVDSWREDDEYGTDDTNYIEFQYDTEKYPNSGVYYCMDVFGIGELPEFFSNTGMFGKTTKNIPVSYKWEDEMGRIYEYVTTGVVYNADGSVRTIGHMQKINGTYYTSSSYSYGYENYPLSSLRSVNGNVGQDRKSMVQRLRERKRNVNVE